MTTSVLEYDYEVAVANEDLFRVVLYTHDDKAIVKIMKDIVA